MALEVRGNPILSFGEYMTLIKGFPRTAPGSPTLAAMFEGADVEPIRAYSALEVDARLSCGGDTKLHDIIDRATARLKSAFPTEVPA